MRRATACLLIVGWLSLPGSGRAEQSELGEAGSIRVVGLAEIHATLKELVSLLELQVANQRTQLAVQRLDIVRREVVARERELHDALTTRDSYEEQQASMEARLEAFERDPEAVGINEEELEEIRLQSRIESESLKQRVWRLDQRILDLRAQLRRAREDLEAWEELVAESF
jgi:chromosome segregation ATPase